MNLDWEQAVKETDDLSEKLFLMMATQKKQTAYHLHEAVNDAKSIVAHLETMENKLSQRGGLL